MPHREPPLVVTGQGEYRRVYTPKLKRPRRKPNYPVVPPVERVFDPAEEERLLSQTYFKLCDAKQALDRAKKHYPKLANVIGEALRAATLTIANHIQEHRP